MRITFRKGAGFGTTSGVITTLGLIAGLNTGTQSTIAVLAGIVVLAVSDALSDAMGIHVSEEAEDEHSAREIWEASAFTFLSKLSITLTFLVPITLLELQTAVATSAIWGLLLVAFFSFWMAKSQKKNPYKAVAEHIMITILVIILTNYLGFLVYQIFMG
ncbi:MAG: hypothetical protein JSV64_05310 [Candidatus Bathyarchaeota archaeon]|nr:MAG: hypothetical protein JSV64_05310 [Candidatus Bathyarchaeota archaeon]